MHFHSLLRTPFCRLSQSSPPKRTFLLEYQWVEDMYYRRLPLREAHLQMVRGLEKKGFTAFGGPTFPLSKSYLVV